MEEKRSEAEEEFVKYFNKGMERFLEEWKSKLEKVARGENEEANGEESEADRD